MSSDPIDNLIAFLPDNPVVTLFLALLSLTTLFSRTLISAMLSEVSGRTAIWFALSDRTLERKVRRLSHWLLKRVTRFGSRTLGIRIARASTLSSDGMVAACLLLVSVGPSLAALFGHAAAWGGTTFSLPVGVSPSFPLELHLLLIGSAAVSALSLFVSARSAVGLSLFSIVLLAVNLHFYTGGWGTNPKWSRVIKKADRALKRSNAM